MPHTACPPGPGWASRSNPPDRAPNTTRRSASSNPPSTHDSSTPPQPARASALVPRLCARWRSQLRPARSMGTASAVCLLASAAPCHAAAAASARSATPNQAVPAEPARGVAARARAAPRWLQRQRRVKNAANTSALPYTYVAVLRPAPSVETQHTWHALYRAR
jgi:hypothetical protein